MRVCFSTTGSHDSIQPYISKNFSTKYDNVYFENKKVHEYHAQACLMILQGTVINFYLKLLDMIMLLGTGGQVAVLSVLVIFSQVTC